MRTIYIAIAAIALSAGAASAQPPDVPQGPPGGPGNIERLTVLLDLDAYQKTEVERILGEQRATMMAERKAREATGERPSFEEMHARREQAQQDTLAKLQGVLTEQQIAKFKLLMEPMGGRGGPGGPGGRGGPPPAGEQQQ